MTDVKRPDTVEGFCALNLSRRLDGIIGRFEALTRDLRLIQDRIDASASGTGSYADLAADAQHAVMDALFNASVHALTRDAQDADRARQRRIAAQTIAERIDEKIQAVVDDRLRPGLRHGADVAREYVAKEG